MLACDFFAVTPDMVGPFDYVYDRGALVALPADIRYVCEAKAPYPEENIIIMIAYLFQYLLD